MDKNIFQKGEIGKRKLPQGRGWNMAQMWRKNAFQTESFHKPEKLPRKKQDTYQCSHALPGQRLTFLYVYAMIMACKYGGRPVCGYRTALCCHGATAKGRRTGAKLSRYLGRNDSRMPFFCLKAVKRREHWEPCAPESIGYRLPMEDWRQANVKRTK